MGSDLQWFFYKKPNSNALNYTSSVQSDSPVRLNVHGHAKKNEKCKDILHFIQRELKSYS